MSKTICMCFILLHYVSLYYYICVRILLYISSMSVWVRSIDKICKKYEKEWATLPTMSCICVLILLYMCPHACVHSTIFVSSY